MNILLKEYLSYIVQEQGPGEPLPDDIESLHHKGYGRYYYDPQFKQYAGRVSNKQWYPAKGVAPSAPRTKATASSDSQKTPAAPEVTVQLDKVAQVAPSTETRSVEVMGGLFNKVTTITRGNQSIDVRVVTNPKTKETYDVSDPTQRALAVEVLDAHIAQLNIKAKAIAKRMSQKGVSKSEKQQLRKWLGNMGEVCGLRDILHAGGEAYLYADSHPKNDIAVVFNYESEADIREIMVVGVSTKSSAGAQGGRKESSSLPFVVESVEGKTIKLGDDDVYAEDAAVALYSIHKLIYSSTTRGYVKRGTNYKEERMFEVPERAIEAGKFDVNKLREAQAEQQAAAKRGEAGGQKKFVESRILSMEDIDTTFDKSSRAYGRIVAKVMKSMGVSKDDNEGIMKASRIVDFYVDRIKQGVAQSTETTPYRLSNTNDMLTDEVVSMLEQTNSNFSFESDLMTATFDAAMGYRGIEIVPSEVMNQRARDKYGDISKMSKREQLLTLANWTFNTRGLGLSSKAGGYIDVLARVSPPLEVLQAGDKLTPEKYLEYLRLLHLQRLRDASGN
jgi:hypothetical protein